MYSPATKRSLTAARLARERYRGTGGERQEIWGRRLTRLRHSSAWLAGRDIGSTCQCDCDCQCHDDMPGACIACRDPTNRSS